MHGSSVLRGERNHSRTLFKGGRTDSKEVIEVSRSHTDLRSEESTTSGEALNKSFEARKVRQYDGTLSVTTEHTKRTLGEKFSSPLDTNIQSTTLVYKVDGQTSIDGPGAGPNVSKSACAQIDVSINEQQGLFTSSTKKTTEVTSLDANGQPEVGKDGKVIKKVGVENNDKLSNSGSAALWALMDGTYDLLWMMCQIYAEKDSKKKNEIWVKAQEKFPTVFVDVFETCGIAWCGEVSVHTQKLGDGLPYAMAVASVSMMCRALLAQKTTYSTTYAKGGEILSDVSTGKKGWQNLALETKQLLTSLPAATGVDTAAAVFKMLQLSAQFIIVWYETGYITLCTFA